MKKRRDAPVRASRRVYDGRGSEAYFLGLVAGAADVDPAGSRVGYALALQVIVDRLGLGLCGDFDFGH